MIVMRSIIKILIVATGVTFGLIACDKTESLPLYGAGKNPTLSVSTTTLAPLPADSNNVALTMNWTFPNHATDSASIKYTIEIDSTGRSFSKEVTKVVIGSLSTAFKAKELNAILLAYGYAFNVPVDMDVRVTSSYGNNNEKLSSNVIKIRMTPYKVPPKVALPTSLKLYIVGDATAGGWNNPVPVPSQELVRLDETTWGGVFLLTGGKQYLLLPVNGDWSHKFAVANNSVAGLNAGGDFGYDLSDNFPGPAATGLYKIIVDFQAGKFSVTAYSGALPTNLFIVGDATAGGWNNPVPVPSQQFTRLNSSVFEITLPLIGGKQYLMLPVNGDWSHKFAVANNSVAGLSAGGDFGYDLSDNFPGPAASGTYKITANFVTKKFTVQ
jgi:starch-binding outer membrane protein SusE/F